MRIGIVGWAPQFRYYRIDLSYRQFQKYERLRDYVSLTEAAEYALRVGRLLTPAAADAKSAPLEGEQL